MSNSAQKEKSSLWGTAAESGAKKAGENVINRALNALADFVMAKYGEAQVLLGAGFKRYLQNASQRYNQVRTLATGTTPRTIIGPGNIYVKVGVSYQEKEISTDTVDPMLRISHNLLILGTGGVGKSMLMRYLFLNTADRGEYVPVMLELRHISKQTPGQLSILELIYSCMKEYDIELPREQFEYSLRLGKYLFLFDGFDEVKEALAAETAEKLQAFSAKYPKNPCIITSRPRDDYSAPLETFTTVESMSLSKEQAVQLSSKIAPEDEKAKEFCRQLEDFLYEKHRFFAGNPLLLSMMFLTFMRNCSIPDHLADFYQKAYDALYNAHDSQNKGYFQRDFKCKALDENKFKLLLSHLCFQTYFKELYEFSERDILGHLEKSIQKLNLPDVRAKDFLQDLCNAVCMIIKDGEVYRFSHRSFQTYFTARYTADILTDEQQKKLFHNLLSGRNAYMKRQNYFSLVYQIERERFSINAFEDELRRIQKESELCPDPDFYWLRLQDKAFDIIFFTNSGDIKVVHMLNSFDNYTHSVITLFHKYIGASYIPPLVNQEYEAVTQQIKELAPKVRNPASSVFYLDNFGPYAPSRTPDEKMMLSAVLSYHRIPQIRQAAAQWLSSLDAKRASLQTPDFIDDL